MMRVLLGATALVLLVMLLSVLVGVSDLSVAAAWQALWYDGDALAHQIVFHIRMPRMLTGALTGAQFAVAGMMLQRLTRNAIADPTVLGISQGAVLAVSVFLFVAVYSRSGDVAHLAHHVVALPVQWMPMVGALGGVLAALLVFLLAGHAGPLHLTLCGIACGALLHALSMGLISGWGSARLDMVLLWMSGSLYGRGWDEVRFLVLALLPLLPVLFLALRPLAVAGFHADLARSMGLEWRLWYPLLVALASALAATAAGVVGPLLFVGLMSPHLAAWVLQRRDHVGALLLMSALCGALLVSVADMAGRLLGGAEEIPVGIVTSILGAPALLVLLNRRSG